MPQRLPMRLAGYEVTSRDMKREIGFLVFPEFQLLDLSGPVAAFEVASAMALGQPYGIQVLSECGGLVRSSSGLHLVTEAAGERFLDTFIVVGGNFCRSPSFSGALIEITKAIAGYSRRTASVCTGAFVLAAAGLLDGKNVTTHWRHAPALQKRYPRLNVDAEPLFTKDGEIWTSAGTNAGIDLALAMIEEDFGYEVSRVTAQSMVVHQRRPGGQSQFAGLLDIEPETERIGKVLDFSRQHLHENLSVERLAEVACLSPRQFSRAFLAETGFSPAKAIERLRAEAARLRIETGQEPIEVVAHKVGFMDPERMRRAFLRLFGQPPQALRRIAASK